MAKSYLSQDELQKINLAVKEAESQTTGEIATALIPASDSYAVYELTFSVFAGFLFFVGLLFFSQPLENYLKRMLWDYSNIYLLMLFGFSTFIVIFLFYLLANLAVVDRLLVPRRVMIRKVRERALRHFLEAGVCHTREQTGILIFISFLERRVELLADQGISSKIGQEQWQVYVNRIVQGVKQNQLADSLCQAIREIGEVLKEHFPHQPDDVNELQDDLSILEK